MVSLNHDVVEELEAEIERLHKEYDCILDDMDDLRAALAKSCEEGRDGMYDCGYNRLRAALEEITEMPTGEPDDAGNMKYVALVALDKLREAGDEAP